MAHIDTSKIEGFDGMTAEQKVAALTGIEIPDSIDMSKYVLKSQFDKTSSDLAEAKRQLKGKMTEDEQKQTERAEKEAADKAAFDDLQSKYDELNKKFMIATYKSSYLNLGYDEKLAQETAEAMANGDIEKVFANQGKHKAALEQKIKEDLMKKDPRPAGGGGSDEKDTAVEMAKRLAKSKSGDDKAIKDTVAYYSLTK